MIKGKLPKNTVKWSDIQNKPSTFTPSSHTHSWSEVDKTGSSIFDLEDVSTPTNANTYMSYDGTQITWKNIYVKAYKYQTGQTYNQGDLIVDLDYTSLFVATQTFTASDIVSDINNGYIKTLNTITSYKQYNAFSKSAGDQVTISLSHTNAQLNRHVFVLLKQPVSAVDIEPFKFDGTDTNLDYDNNWVIMDGDAHLKNSDILSTTSENIYHITNDVDLSQYKDVIKINVTFF